MDCYICFFSSKCWTLILHLDNSSQIRASMSELSAAEKRKLLRERRAAKLNTASSARLGKITGSNNSHLPSTSPLDTATTSSGSAGTDSAGTTTSSSSHAEDAASIAARKKSNRISQSFSDKDPEVSDISSLLNKPTKSVSSDNLLTEEDENFPDTNPEDIMNKLLENMLKQGHDHTGSPTDQGPLPNDFMKTMSSFLNGSGPDPFGFGSAGIGGETESKSMEDLNYESKLALYDQYCLRKFKLGFTFFRFFMIFGLMYRNLFGFVLHYPTFDNVRNSVDTVFTSKIGLWNEFLFLEVILSLFYFIFSGMLPRKTNGGVTGMILSLVEGFLPPRLKSYFQMAMKYKEIFGFFMNDLAFLIIMLGLLALKEK